MSALQYPVRINSKDVQIWDNAAFDNGCESESQFSWLDVEKNRSFESVSDCSKENLSPSVVGDKSLGFARALKVNNVVANAMPKTGLNQDCVERDFNAMPKTCLNKDCVGKDLDVEIEEIEKEISRLSTRLECLRLEKVKRNVKVIEKRGRMIGVAPKKGVRCLEEERKSDESMNVSGKMKTPRRGVSLGPSEIMRGMRRGVSIGPMEIYSATKLKEIRKHEMITPVQASADRRKSCYWKLQDIDELRVTKQRGMSMSLSPKSRCKSVIKPQIPKQAATTVGARKTVKKEVGVISSIQPKKLFVKDGEKSAPSKKSVKAGRVVPSRYNQITSGGSSALKELRKRSWPENEEEMKRSDKKRVSLAAKSEGSEQGGTESRVKKRWDVPNVDQKTPLSVTKILEAVPRIKTVRCKVESPRDSGPAKRVADLVGKKSFFSMDDGDDKIDDEFVCQALNFEEGQATKEYPKIRVLRSINDSPRDSGAAKRVSQLVGRKPFFAVDDDDEMPVFSFEEDVE